MKKLAIACVLVACSSSSTSPTPPATVATDPEKIVTFEMDVTVPPASEVYKCQFLRMPKTPDGGEIFIGAQEHDYTPGSHHYLLYRTSLDSIPAELSKQLNCFEGEGVMKYQQGYIAGGQEPEGHVVFPPGVAQAFKSEEVLLFQAHYVNAGSKPIDAKVNVRWTRVDKSTVEQRVGVTNFYNPFIYVPPKGTGRAPMRCPINHDITILGAGPHMHARGVFYQAFLDEPAKAPATTPFYTTTDWDHPKSFVGPLEVHAGTRVRFECQYKNDTDQPFVQGQSALTDEMCMFTALYYPEMSVEENQCRSSDGWMDELGTKTDASALNCSQLGACMQSCPKEDQPAPGVFPPKIGVCVQKCMSDSCPSASTYFMPQLDCLQKNCATDCAGMSDACTTCMTNKCPTVAIACLNHTCGG
ncbi:MAG: monooxygenase [Polyangiales bacterium]